MLLGAGVLDPGPRYRHRVAEAARPLPRLSDRVVAADVAALRREDLETGPLTDDLELRDGVRTLEVGCDEQRRRLRSLSQRPSLPANVVLPEPCRPASMMTVGGSGEPDLACLAAEDRNELLVDDLDDLLPGG